jgi:hypothetical protein
MKFINYLTSIAGVSIFPLISLFIFFLFFSVIIIWAVKVSKEHIAEMEQIPLNSDKVNTDI